MRPMLGMLVLYRFGSGSMSLQQKEDIFLCYYYHYYDYFFTCF